MSSGQVGVASRHNLPADVSSFVGRDREVAGIENILRGARLVTLTGAGGSGKTRLALRIASRLLPSFADGVWLVQLAPVAHQALVPRAVATTLGVRGTPDRPISTAIAAALAPRRMLLILDNCEHVVDAAARLAETLLHFCPHLRILATSREPLQIPGEITWRVPALATPESRASPIVPETLAEVEAVALFLDRARARQSDFALSDRNAASVAAICRRMEGLPLGIELAAAQVGVLSPEQIAARLDDALRLLGGGSRTQPRQETLRATLDWSYSLLDSAERALLSRLAVFAGGFDADAAEGICDGDGIDRDDVLRLLRALVEKSLVEPRVQGPEVRYRLLEPVRQYAMERLAADREVDMWRRRHAQYFLALAETAEPALMSGRRDAAIQRLTAQEDNLRAALAWSRDGVEGSDVEIGLRLAGALCWFWNLRGEVSEGLEWVEAALAKGPDAAPAIRAKALYAAGEMAWLAGRPALGRERIEECIALWRALGEKRGLAYALQALPMAVDNPEAEKSVAEALRLFEEVGDAWGSALALATPDLFALTGGGDPNGRSRARLEEALARWRELDDGWGAAQVLNMIGDLSRNQGDDAQAAACYEEALSLLRRQGLTGTIPSLLQNLGYLALRRGDPRRALRLFREGLALFQDQGDQRGIADCLDGLAGVMTAMRQPERAARLFGTAEALREEIGASVWPANQADHERALAALREQMDKQALAIARTAGRALSPGRAIEEFIPSEPAAGQPAGRDGFDLTPREREVVTLVAQGLTNRQIAAELVITEGTARLHVKHILHKLGFTSRAQIARWAAEQRLLEGAASD